MTSTTEPGRFTNPRATLRAAWRTERDAAQLPGTLAARRSSGGTSSRRTSSASRSQARTYARTAPCSPRRSADLMLGRRSGRLARVCSPCRGSLAAATRSATPAVLT